MNNVISFTNYYRSWNLTEEATKRIFYPKNTNDIKKILKKIYSEKEKFLIKTGNCGHGDKTVLSNGKYVISLKNLNKIKKFNKRKKTIDLESGCYLFSVVKYLEKKSFKILNVPGGKTVSVGGAIAGNVHGRPQMQKYSVFGDNIIFLKVLDENGVIKKISRKNKLFFDIVGGLGTNGVIIEARVKIFEIKSNNYVLKNFLINSKKAFYKFDKKNRVYYGYLNYFNNDFLGKFFTINEANKNLNHEIKKKKDIFFKIINILKIDTLMSFFINNLSLKIFYFLIFLIFRNNLFKKNEYIDFKRSIYFINVNTYLPYYFRKGMIEIQFSVEKGKLFHLIDKLKKLQSNNNVYPYFFILKKMEKSHKKYIFNFPKYNHCISIGFPKKTVIRNKIFFKSLYKILGQYSCNLYITKDEIFMDYTSNLGMIINKKRLKSFNKLSSSDFKEKILKKFSFRKNNFN